MPNIQHKLRGSISIAAATTVVIAAKESMFLIVSSPFN